MILFLDPGTTPSTTRRSVVRCPTDAAARRNVRPADCHRDGYAEHAFTWDTMLRIRAMLTELAYAPRCRVVTTTRPAVVDERAGMCNSMRPNARVSIDGDGGRVRRGFHVDDSGPPLNTAQAGPLPSWLDHA